MGEVSKQAGADAFGHAVQVLGGDLSQYDLDLALEREAERRERVIARLVFVNGALMDYHHKMSAGFVKPIPESCPSKALPNISLFEYPRLSGGLTKEELALIDAAGIAQILKWKADVGFDGKLEFALWLPDLGHNRDLPKAGKRAPGRMQVQERTSKQPQVLRFTDYPPAPVIWNNIMHREHDYPKLYEEEVGEIHLVAIVDCEKPGDLQSLYERFGEPF